MSGKAPKRKGNGFEREIVNAARDKGLDAERAYASNGKSLGLTDDVDALVEGKPIQAKRKKALPAWLGMSDNVFAVVTREDRGTAYAIVRLDDLLDLLKTAKELTNDA